MERSNRSKKIQRGSTDSNRVGYCNETKEDTVDPIDPIDPIISKGQGTMYRYWSFTWNNYDDPEGLAYLLKAECTWYIYQEEMGTNGTPHLQGTICLEKKQRLTSLKRINPKIHWEATKSVKASVAYCLKEDSRSGKQWVYGIDVPQPVEVDEPYGWQLKAINLLSQKPDKRTVYWFWESSGNVGKSQLTRYLVAKHNALMLDGKSQDMFLMIAENPDKRRLIIIDVPRSSQDFINYGAIEKIKNGLIFSGKYKSCQILFNHPHVIVFANIPPDYTKLSADRWIVQNIRAMPEFVTDS